MPDLAWCHVGKLKLADAEAGGNAKAKAKRKDDCQAEKIKGPPLTHKTRAKGANADTERKKRGTYNARAESRRYR